MAAKALLIFSLLALILFNGVCSVTKADDDEDLSFLEEEDAVSSDTDLYHHGGGEEYNRDFENYDDLDNDPTYDSGDHEAYTTPDVDEKDVVVLKGSNFSDFVAVNRYVMVEFYAPWCGHCQALAPEYAAATTELKGEAVLEKNLRGGQCNKGSLCINSEPQGRDAIVPWVKKKTGPGIYNLTTVEEVECILNADSKAVLGFLDILVGPQSEELAAASRLEDDLLFATSNDSQNLIPTFREAAKAFKGKLIFVYMEMDNEDVGKPVSDYFGVAGDAPRVLAYTGNDDDKKFVLDGEMTSQSIKNDGDVKVVVGNNFDDVVLDESKDVLLEIYALWYGHCQSLEPIYNKFGKHLRGIDSLIIAKMDGTTNEHPRAKSDGFPTILFFPAGNKSFDPITVDTDRTVVAFYKFLKKHASIPFKLQKPASTQKTQASDTVESPKISDEDVKDEL
ncbi:PDI-like 1-4 [Actinidia rufa]|uniref:PDI-like 1-4 n=1 Tax=Actinidia rufa TaxID=165716 RepID=A0A7J0EDJ9_9ERIC|nr:PDI-like 1-4 [Actinidia rufa]